MCSSKKSTGNKNARIYGKFFLSYFGLDKGSKIATGYVGAMIFESLQLIKRVIVNLIIKLVVCIYEISKPVACQYN